MGMIPVYVYLLFLVSFSFIPLISIPKGIPLVIVEETYSM